MTAPTTPPLDASPPAPSGGPAPRVIGLDLSLTGTGIATIAADSSATVQTITSKGKADATLDQRHGRLHNLRLDIALAIKDPALVVIEQPAFSRQNGHMHDRSGLWWMVVDWLANSPENDGWGYTVVEVTPTCRAKYATGKGNAGKDQVLAAVVRRYPDVDVQDNNQADALVLAAMGARHLGHPIDDLPLTHLAAMTAVQWPEVRV